MALAGAIALAVALLAKFYVVVVIILGLYVVWMYARIPGERRMHGWTDDAGWRRNR